MRRRSSLSLFVVLLACATAAGSEFRFAARVDLMPWMTVRTDASGAAADGSPAVRVVASQDQCLDVSVNARNLPSSARNAVESALSAGSTRSTTSAVDSQEVLADGVRILQITLN